MDASDKINDQSCAPKGKASPLLLDAVKQITHGIASFWQNLRLLLRESVILLTQSGGAVVLFVLLHAAASIAIVDVSATGLLQLGMRLSGVRYVAPETMKAIFLNPLCIPLEILFAVMLVCLSIFEIGGILHACTMGKVGMKTTVQGMILEGFHGCARVLHPKNWLLILYLLVLMPLAGVLSFSTSLFFVSIPEFIQDYINANRLYHYLNLAVYGLLVLVQLQYIFSIHAFLLEEKDFIPACKSGAMRIRKNYLRTVAMLFITDIAATAAIVALSSVLTYFGYQISQFITGLAGRLTQTHYLSLLTSMMKGYLGALFTPVITLGVLTTLYFQFCEEKQRLTRLSKRCFHDERCSKPKLVGMAVAAVAIGAAYLIANYSSVAHFSDASARPAIVAHRGDSVNAPENTMPAFQLAVLEQPEWVELDVQQTKDGAVIVCHDDDLSRICGKKLYVHELTYEETQTLDVGSRFSKDYAGTKLSTLDEVLKLFAPTDIKVQIEIKINGFENQLEERVLEIINENGMHDRCIITSLQPKPLKRVHELDPTMLTAYSMYVAMEGVENLDFSDYVTIEYNNYNRKMVDTLHDAGKLCFAWTANTEDSIQYLVDCGVDGILTDNPIMLRNALDRADYSGGILRFLRLLNELLLYGY